MPATFLNLTQALSAEDASIRLKAALTLGSHPDPALLDTLIARCATEADFYVRDMLTWALTRFPADLTHPKLLAELRSPLAQARSQALHTLSKMKDARTWPEITSELLSDPDDEVARSAWRAAVVLVPEAEKQTLAMQLASQLGRGDRNVQLSLSRALLALGEECVAPMLQQAMASQDEAVRAHARATEKILRDPDAGFAPDINEARRVFVLGKER